MWIKTNLGAIYNCDKFDLIGIEEDTLLKTFYIVGFVGGTPIILSDTNMTQEAAEELRDNIYDNLESDAGGFDVMNH